MLAAGNVGRRRFPNDRRHTLHYVVEWADDFFGAGYDTRIGSVGRRLCQQRDWRRGVPHVFTPCLSGANRRRS